jgi:hypothetical protein
MRTNRTVFGIVLFLALVSASSAQEGVERILGERRVKLVSQEAAAGRFAYTYATADNVKFGVESAVELSAGALRSLFRLWDAVFSWESLTPGSQNFRVVGDSVTLRLVPGTFASGGRDLKPFVPSGLAFTIAGDRIEYDFRLKTGPYFIRLEGRLQSESVFLERFKRAVDDPAAFARENDPDYISRRIVELQESLENSDEARKTADTESDRRTAALEARITALEESLAALSAALETRLAEADARAAENEKRDSYERKALINAYAKANPKPVPADLVERIRSAKASRPAATSAEIVAALKAQGVSTTEKIVKAVVAVLFGE